MNIFSKKGLFFIILSSVIFPMASFSYMTQPETSRHLDIELPFRCSSTQLNEGEKISTSVALSDRDFTIRLPNQSSRLPRYNVNGFSFKNKTVDVVVAELLESAGIKVMAEEGTYPTLSAENLRGELSAVLEELMHLGNFFYTYNADKKILYLSRKTKAVIQIPHNDMVMMAVVDALNGGHFDPIEANWDRYQITLRLTKNEMADVQGLLANLVKEKYILAAEIELYALDADMPNTHWQQIIDKLGRKNIASIQNALIGQAIYLRPNVSERSFLNTTERYFDPMMIASGKVVVPSGWRTRFNFNQCVQYTLPYQDLSLFLKTSVRAKGRAQTVLTLDSKNGEIASFDLDNNLNQKVVIVGIPTPKNNDPYQNQELMLTLKFHFIQLIKKGEQNG